MATTVDADSLKKLWDMIQGIKVAMLASHDAGEGGHLRARPMVASQSSFDGTLYFFTRASSHKVDEVEHAEQVCVSYADPDHQNYVSLSGRARTTSDPALIKSHWSEAMRTWFPKGTDDPDIAILKVDVDQAEYWDAPSSAMVYLYGYAKAVATGKSPHPGENVKLTLS